MRPILIRVTSMKAPTDLAGRYHLLPWALAPLALAVAGGLVLLGTAPANPAPARLTRLTTHHLPLETSPNPIRLTVFREGEALEQAISIRNTRDDPLTLERVETSCSCVRVSPLPLEVGPGQTAFLFVRFDPQPDEGLQGPLSVELAGYFKGGKLAFRTEVKIQPTEDQ